MAPPPRPSASASSPKCGRDPLRPGVLRGGGPGFRRADTLTRCLEAELAFYLAEFTSRLTDSGVPPTAAPVREVF